MPAARDQAPGHVVAQLRVLARLELGRVVGREHVLDQRAILQPAAVRVGVDPFRAQALHLGTALVEFDDSVDALALIERQPLIFAGRRAQKRRLALVLVLSWWVHRHTILSTVGACQASGTGPAGPVRAG